MTITISRHLKLDMYRCSKLIYTDVQCNKTDLSGGQNLFSQESLPNMHILSPDIFCGNKNLSPGKMPGRSKVVPDKTEF